jgi:hypothetical protein
LAENKSVQNRENSIEPKGTQKIKVEIKAKIEDETEK